MTAWQKIPEDQQSERFRAPYYLEVREGKYRTSYRINFRGNGLDLREVLEGEFASWKEALKKADEVLSKAKYGEKKVPRALVRCEVLCHEIVALKSAKDESTYRQAETFFRLHIIPFLNDSCPYASELNATVWLRYKNHIRLKNPKVALFNHWKFFVQLFKYAHEKAILPNKIKLEYSEQREDFRARGLIISDADFEKIIAAASTVWKARISIQRETGMRPGEVRDLRKDRYDSATRTISLRKEDTKTRQARSFMVTKRIAAILDSRLPSDSPYFFSNERDHLKPMDKHLRGWNSTLKHAFDPDNKGLDIPGYTPHDIRHSYLTRMFKTSQNPALICYQSGLSLDEAQKTYLHFEASDTRSIVAEIEPKEDEAKKTETQK